VEVGITAIKMRKAAFDMATVDVDVFRSSVSAALRQAESYPWRNLLFM